MPSCTGGRRGWRSFRSRSTSTDGAGFEGAIGFAIGAASIAEAGRIAHPAVDGYAPPIGRSLVVGDTLYTLSSSGLAANSVTTLGSRSFTALG